jgi:hypothetical protein
LKRIGFRYGMVAIAACLWLSLWQSCHSEDAHDFHGL